LPSRRAASISVWSGAAVWGAAGAAAACAAGDPAGPVAGLAAGAHAASASAPAIASANPARRPFPRPVARRVARKELLSIAASTRRALGRLPLALLDPAGRFEPLGARPLSQRPALGQGTQLARPELPHQDHGRVRAAEALVRAVRDRAL